ncbi:MAG TPA: RsfS/YbeB/iojap family protein, partial [Chlamydiales bacterium]|nr:RsfS/YbeB/iojap family protein [Chlamydiales bacterium]
AIAHALMEGMGEKPPYVEGLQTGDWVVIDYSEIMIHLFMPGLREKYQLERLYPDSKIVELDIDYSNEKVN